MYTFCVICFVLCLYLDFCLELYVVVFVAAFVQVGVLRGSGGREDVSNLLERGR